MSDIENDISTGILESSLEIAFQHIRENKEVVKNVVDGKFDGVSKEFISFLARVAYASCVLDDRELDGIMEED